MTLCVRCATPVLDGTGMHSWHNAMEGDCDSDWSQANRIWCGYFHRGVEIPRLEEYWNPPAPPPPTPTPPMEAWNWDA